MLLPQTVFIYVQFCDISVSFGLKSLRCRRPLSLFYPNYCIILNVIVRGGTKNSFTPGSSRAHRFFIRIHPSQNEVLSYKQEQCQVCGFVLGMRAVLLSLRHFKEVIQVQYLLMATDNTTIVAYCRNKEEITHLLC